MLPKKRHKSPRLPLTGRKLREQLLKLLRKQGLSPNSRLSPKECTRTKDKIRDIHSYFRRDHMEQEYPFVAAWFPRLSKYFASGSEVDPVRVQPYPVLVEDNEELSALFRLASLWWSVPVSKGFGRRFRILIFDRSNDKLFGLLGLTDPVFNLRTRDSSIGWTVRTREDRLAHVMDAHVLGAVPPYNRLLGAKFVALLAASDYTRNVFRHRYGNVRTQIRRRTFDGRLAMVTTTSALGKSSILNRLRFGGMEVFRSVGYTEGYGHFHLANGTFEKLREYLRACRDQEISRYKFGNGPNYRIRVVRKALEHLQLPPDLLRHGVRRGVYIAPLAANSTAFLRGEASKLLWYHRPLDEVLEFWRERWLLPRASRDPSYRDFHAGVWRQTLGLIP